MRRITISIDIKLGDWTQNYGVHCVQFIRRTSTCKTHGYTTLSRVEEMKNLYLKYPLVTI
jgi:hypothetical protein